MIKKKSLILSLVVILLNFPTQSFSYSQNNFQQLATLNQESGTGGGSGGSESQGGDSSGNPGENADGQSGESQNGGSTGNGNVTQVGDTEVELDGAIGQWEPDNNQLPDFSDINDSDFEGNKPEVGDYFTISATVPLQMDFLIKNENENGSSPNGKFITAYYKVKNNGSYPLKIEVESFREATSTRTRTSDLVTGQLEKLYVEEPVANDDKVQMKLHLTYDRTSNSYLKKIDLHNFNKSTKLVDKTLGTIDPNEEARLYYGSDLWETPKSEGITTGVESTFKLKLIFSLKKDTNGNANSGNDNTTGTEGNSSTNVESNNGAITE